MLGEERVFTGDIWRIAYGADAGCYAKHPGVVIRPDTEAEVSDLLQELNTLGIPLTFRAAGTSLSGQSVTDSVLLLAAGDRWEKTEILEEGELVRTRPGITGSRLNQRLKPFNRQFGPDPASINSAMVGGIIANNASGMSCGTHSNSYATIQSARILLCDGTILDTSDPASRREFEITHGSILQELTSVRDSIRSNPEQRSFIREKYAIKNTTGYALNAFLDYDDPFDILLHLMVGSEGTLAFISEASFRTVPLTRERASSLLYFNTMEAACEAVPVLKSAGVSAIELMDRQALRSVEDKPGIPGFIKEFDEQVAALLIDLEAAGEKEMDSLIAQTREALEEIPLERDVDLTRDPREIREIWKIRKGVFPSVGGMRPPGTSVIIEDVAVKLEYLTSAVKDIRSLLDELGYTEAVIYGHALDGNLHFIFSQDFEKEEELSRYEQLIDRLVTLVVDKYNGSLKAEHGTGINMAPFVEYEWGGELYSLMVRIKKAFDPGNILNPGALVNPDPRAHLQGLKALPVVDQIIDKCIECGFCEINCLSTGLTLSARQRIVVQREIKKLDSQPGTARQVRRLQRQFRYAGDQTCAVDGLCAISCPVEIDTGEYIKKYRQGQHRDRRLSHLLSDWVAGHFKTVKGAMRVGLGSISGMHAVLGSRVFGFLARGARAVSFSGIPRWTRYMPKPVTVRVRQPDISLNGKPGVVYFPSCINQVMGPARFNNHNRSLIDVTERVLRKAGYEVIYPDNMSHLCCGMPWESKGFRETADKKSGELERALLRASSNGKYPVLCDTSPCIYRMRKVMDPRLKLYEPVEFIHDFLLDIVPVKKLDEPLAFHITCSSTKMGLEEKFKTVAGACTSRPVFPEEVGCCGFAGDRGFSYPELNDWSLRKLRPAVGSSRKGYSNSRTCEIGLSHNSGIHYESIMYLVDDRTG